MSLIHLTSLAEIPAAEWDALLPDDQPFLRHAFLLTLETERQRAVRGGLAARSSAVAGGGGDPRRAARLPQTPFTGRVRL